LIRGCQSHSLGTRQLAGVLIKNSFTARGLQLGVERRQRWATLAADTKQQIRVTLLQALGSHAVEIRLTTAQVGVAPQSSIVHLVSPRGSF
jgi:hypothetical protein